MVLLVRATLNINDALLDELKTRARVEQRPMTKVIEEALQKGLAQKPTGSTQHPKQIKTYPVGIKPAYQGMSMNQLT